MTTISATKARQNLYKILREVNIGYNPITIVNKNGTNAVLISEDEWNSIQETLYLSSIPGFVESIKEIDNSEDWSNAKVYDSEEEW